MARPPETCPHCGAEVPPNASACPECGSDELTGWSEDAAAQHLDLPDQEFNYDEFVQNEFGPSADHPVRTRGISWFWWVVALLIVVAFVLMFVRF